MGSNDKQHTEPKEVIGKEVQPKEVKTSQTEPQKATSPKVTHLNEDSSKKALSSVKKAVPKVKDNTSVSTVDNYGIPHPRLKINEERILSEIKGEAKIELDEETLQKIESEVKDTVF
jgi:hypothetical protein